MTDYCEFFSLYEQGTGGLALRIGLNSGPTTAGVLRGEKSRFQLFGDVRLARGICWGRCVGIGKLSRVCEIQYTDGKHGSSNGEQQQAQQDSNFTEDCQVA
jgi:hypothetical protein